MTLEATWASICEHFAVRPGLDTVFCDLDGIIFNSKPQFAHL